jgi:hypothetical protein
MRLRLVISSIVLAALAANPCFGKGGHAQHGARAGTVNNGASGKGAGGNGTSAKPVPSKADMPIDAETAVAPPVLPPRAVTQQQIRAVNPSVKTANPGNSGSSRASAMTITAPTARNAIGQSIVSPKNFSIAQPQALQRPGVGSPIIHAGSAATTPVSSGTARVNVATNRGSVNGATMIRPAGSSVGGPAQARYGINGATVQNRR